MTTAPLPPGFGLVLGQTTRRYASGTVLVGGVPPRIVRLSPAGRDALTRLLEGDPQAPVAARRLGRRLVATGLTHPAALAGAESTLETTVVIPVKDRPGQLRRLLSALPGDAKVVIVDDGSADPVPIARAAHARDAGLIRHERPLGPAAARNAGLARVQSELVAFIDSDCVAPGDWLERLTGHFADPRLGALAPRIVPAHTATHRWFDCTLDMGPEPAPVTPVSRVPYVPSACLIARRAALEQARGFAPELKVGEDVDLVWRLHDAGWAVRYEPSVEVAHEEPGSLRAIMRRRARYGTSAAPLAIRHPGRITHLVVSPALAAATGLWLLPRTGRAALLLIALPAARISRTLTRAGVPPAPAAKLTLATVADSLAGLARAATMFTAPLLLAGLANRRARPKALTLLTGPPIYRWLRAGPAGRRAQRERHGALATLHWTFASIAEDAAYGAGVLAGCLTHRTAAPLRPVLKRRRG